MGKPVKVNDMQHPRISRFSKVSVTGRFLMVAGSFAALAGIALLGEVNHIDKPLAQNAGEALKEWSVQHSPEGIVTTNEFMEYSSYLSLLDRNALPPANISQGFSEGMMVKVMKPDNKSSNFTVCAYEIQSPVTSETKTTKKHFYTSESGTIAPDNGEDACA